MTETVSEPSTVTAGPASSEGTVAKSTRGRLAWPSTGIFGERTWRNLTIRATIAYLLSRLCVVAGAAVVAAQRVKQDQAEGVARPTNAVHKIIDVLTSWDGKWYLSLIHI